MLNIENRIKKSQVAAALGRTVSPVSGGNFANGASTEAYSGLFTDPDEVEANVDDGQRAVDAAGSVLNASRAGIKGLIKIAGSEPLTDGASKLLDFNSNLFGNVGLALELSGAESNDERALIVGLEVANRALEANPSVIGPVSKAWNLASAFVNATVGREIMPDAATMTLKMVGARARDMKATCEILDKTDPHLSSLHRHMMMHPGMY